MFVGPVNNARDLLEKHKNHINVLLKKKRKEKENIDVGLFIIIQTSVFSIIL